LHYVKTKILKAQLKDLNQILYIEKSSFNYIDQFSKSIFKYFIKKRRLWIVKLDKNIIGYFILICYKKSIRIYSIALLPEYRNRGIGGKMLSFIIKLAVFLKKYKIVLEVRTSNKSKTLYERFGFKVKKILKNYYENEDGYKMELLLKKRR
jgi:ribosomal-protein-alanine N-acetyltransferase